MSDRPRICQVIVPLPERKNAQERILTLDADVREAMTIAEKKLRDYATKFTVTGWVADDDAEYAVTNRNVVGRLRITRGAP